MQTIFFFLFAFSSFSSLFLPFQKQNKTKQQLLSHSLADYMAAPCRYYATGYCIFGAGCSFSHAGSAGVGGGNGGVGGGGAGGFVPSQKLRSNAVRARCGG